MIEDLKNSLIELQMSTSNQINNNEKAIIEKDGNTIILQHRIHQLEVKRNSFRSFFSKLKFLFSF